MQWMRQEETAWDTKGPAYSVKLRGGLDAHGQLVALHYDACAADHNHLGYNEHDTVLISQLMGTRKPQPSAGRASLPSDMYAIPNRLQTTRVVPLPMPFETPLRTGNLRDPDGPQVTFASESFIDEARGRGEGGSGRVPAEDAAGKDATTTAASSARARSPASRRRRRSSAGSHDRRQFRVPQGRRCHRRDSHRPRHRLRVSQPDRGRRDLPRSKSIARPAASGSSGW